MGLFPRTTEQDFDNGDLAAIWARLFNNPGQSSGLIVTRNNTIVTTNGTPYAIGDNIGGIISILTVADSVKKSGMYVSITLTDNSNQRPALEIYFFSATPPNGTYTNDAAQIFNDKALYLGKIVIAAAEWTQTQGSTGLIATVEKRVQNLPFNLAGTTIFAAIKTLTAVTYGSAAGLEMVSGISKD